MNRRKDKSGTNLSTASVLNTLDLNLLPTLNLFGALSRGLGRLHFSV